MEITFRWFGEDDPVPLEYIKQIPAVRGIVSALYDISIGDIWTKDNIEKLKSKIERAGLKFSVIESIPVHEDIKLGKPWRETFIENYCESIKNMGKAGVNILCYNFMPVFDWTRSNLAMENDDGSKSLSYRHEDLQRINLKEGTKDLPGWAAHYSKDELQRLMEEYSNIDDEKLWDNLEYFLKRVVPVAEASGVRMAIHPDDPPWPIFGLPRIVKNENDLVRLTEIVDSPSNGITFCTGSLGPNSSMDLVKTLELLVKRKKVHFVHMRNIKRTGDSDFYESSHPTESGDVDMYGIMKVLVKGGFDGVIRPDHGRMIWGEEGKPGYGLYDRALGAMYLAGLKEGVLKSVE